MLIVILVAVGVCLVFWATVGTFLIRLVLRRARSGELWSSGPHTDDD
ncbi:MAG TPA: hypothetical protein VH373_10705 [Jatrophihabitantaceae bacterium]